MSGPAFRCAEGFGRRNAAPVAYVDSLKRNAIMAKNSVPGVTDVQQASNRIALIALLQNLSRTAENIRNLLIDEGLYDDSGILAVEYCDWRVRFNGKVAELTDVSEEVPF